MKNPILSIKNLSVVFQRKKGIFRRETMKTHAVCDVSLEVFPEQIVGIVGESGSGKSTLVQTIMGLVHYKDGEILWHGKPIAHHHLSMKRDIQIIFQSPMASLNSKMTVLETLLEPLKIHEPYLTPPQAYERVLEALHSVDLQEHCLYHYPYELSGGQAQRVMIARALTVRPKLIICDEAVSALDISIKAQILNLFKRLKKQLKLSLIFISHDLLVIQYISDWIYVMYHGHIVEYGDSKSVYETPLHPYTKFLFLCSNSALFDEEAEQKQEKMESIGCIYQRACPQAKKTCEKKQPLLATIQPQHCVACVLYKPPAKPGNV